MRIMLLACHTAPSPQAVPLGTAFLKSSFSADQTVAGRVEIILKHFFINEFTEKCTAAILADQPDAVGFSMYAWNRAFCLDIAMRLRKELQQPLLFAGGPEATADATGVLADGSFDFVIVGEGEIPFREAAGRMLAGKTLGGIGGLVERGTSPPASAAPQAAARLEDLPSPYLDGTLDPAAYGGVLWQLSRGCGFNCDFCFDNRGSGGVRYFPLQRVEEELRLFVVKGVQQVFVLDSTFNLNRQRAKTILKMIARMAPHIHFHFEIRSEFLDEEMVRLFSGITCSLQIGLQSTDPQVLKLVNRHFDLDDFRRRIAMLNDYGIIFGFDLIYGLPGDTLPGFMNSLDVALKLYPNHLDIFPLAVLPGTALAMRADSGLRHLSLPPYTVIETPTFSQTNLARAGAVAKACDIFYSRGKAVAWFNSVNAALAVTPSHFFDLFHAWLKKNRNDVAEDEMQDEEIWRLQRDFLQSLFTGKKLGKLLNLALDLADYHYHYASLLLLPQIEPGPERPSRNASDRYILHEAVRLVSFSYDIDEILEAGEVDLAEFVRHHRQERSYAVMYPGGGEVRTEALHAPFFRILAKLKKPTSLEELAAPGIAAADIGELWDFAVREGIVVKAEEGKTSYRSLSP